MLAWVKRWGAWVLGALAVLLGAGWIWRGRSGRELAALDQARVARAVQNIEVLRGQRKAYAELLGDSDKMVAQIDDQLRRNKRALVEAVAQPARELSDEEVEDEFARLGY